MLLDDQAWFPYLRGRHLTFMYEMINIAQIKTIEKYYAIQEERALRTLYTKIEDVIDGDIIPNFMYPRALVVKGEVPFTSRFEPNDIYINYVKGFGSAAGFPKTAVYTINQQLGTRNAVQYILNFNDSLLADFYYLFRPSFGATTQWINGMSVQGIALPPEYHLEVCCLTAELINDLDVNEQERGEPVYQNQRMNLKDTL
jgi:hypothetical protein